MHKVKVILWILIKKTTLLTIIWLVRRVLRILFFSISDPFLNFNRNREDRLITLKKEIGILISNWV